jgi:hypothetical protein
MMNKEKVIEVLEDLKDYVNENWDESEYKKEMDEAEEAINIAVSTLKQATVCGTLEIREKKYNIVEVV